MMFHNPLRHPFILIREIGLVIQILNIKPEHSVKTFNNVIQYEQFETKKNNARKQSNENLVFISKFNSSPSLQIPSNFVLEAA